MNITESQVENGRMFRLHDDKERWVGMAIASSADHTIILDTIHVFPQERHKGYGKALLNAVQDWGRSVGATEITGEFLPEIRGGLDETYARRFYAQNGVEIDENNILRKRI